MSQIGTIKQYHNGSTYSLAGIYNDKAAELEFDTLSNSGLPDGCITAKVVYFDAETGIMSSWYKGEVSNLSTAFYINGKRNDATAIDFITSENALNFDKSQKTYLRTAANISPVINSKSTWTIECWYCVNTSAESDTGLIFSTGRSAKTVNDGNTDARTYSYSVLNFSYSYTPTTAEIFFGTSRPSGWTYVRELDRSVFNSPFHMAIVGCESGQHNRIYINGQLYCYQNTTASTFPVYNIEMMMFGVGVKYNSSSYVFSVTTTYYNGALSSFRLTFGARYHENFTPQSFEPKVIPVNANMLIRHNGANCYIPMTSNKSYTTTPCLAVRHGSTNYYAIK